MLAPSTSQNQGKIRGDSQPRLHIMKTTSSVKEKLRGFILWQKITEERKKESHSSNITPKSQFAIFLVSDMV
jgi:hypothetical protein